MVKTFLMYGVSSGLTVGVADWLIQMYYRRQRKTRVNAIEVVVALFAGTALGAMLGALIQSV